MPSPLGEGQGNMPINTLIWVRSNRPLSRLPQGGEAFAHQTKIFLEIQLPHPKKRTQHHALSLGRGASQHADCYDYLGEVKPTRRSIIPSESVYRLFAFIQFLCFL